MRRLEGVLFDLDGVLVDSHRAIVALWHDLATRFGRQLSDDDIDRHVLGCSPEHTVQALFAEQDAADREAALAAVRAAEPDLAFDVAPGAEDLVSRLHAAGVHLGLVTGASRSRTERVLGALGLRSAFGTLVTWGDVERGKPAPDCYRLGARRLGLEPAECLVFEDAPSGVTAAVRAGAVCIGVGDEKRLATAGATWTVPDLTAVRCQAGDRGVTLELSTVPVAVLAVRAALVRSAGTP